MSPLLYTCLQIHVYSCILWLQGRLSFCWRWGMLVWILSDEKEIWTWVSSISERGSSSRNIDRSYSLGTVLNKAAAPTLSGFQLRRRKLDVPWAHLPAWCLPIPGGRLITDVKLDGSSRWKWFTASLHSAWTTGILLICKPLHYISQFFCELILYRSVAKFTWKIISRWCEHESPEAQSRSFWTPSSEGARGCVSKTDALKIVQLFRH